MKDFILKYWVETIFSAVLAVLGCGMAKISRGGHIYTYYAIE